MAFLDVGVSGFFPPDATFKKRGHGLRACASDCCVVKMASSSNSARKATLEKAASHIPLFNLSRPIPLYFVGNS